MKKLLGVFSVIAMLFAIPANADVTAGFTLQIGQYNTDGTETEKTVSGVTSETNSASKSKDFYGGTLFAEWYNDSGFAIGIDYMPMDIKLGKGSRTDGTGSADVAAEADTGDRTAEASMNGLLTIYTHVPVGPMYAILGYHDADITTKESLPNSTYGDSSINGWQYGVGIKRDRIRLDLVYSDFESITLNSTANTNKITADADALAARFSFAF